MIKLPVLYSQRDNRWKLKKLGYGTGSIGNYGCLLVSYTMLVNHFEIKLDPIDVNNDMKREKGYSGDTKNLWNWFVADNIYDTIYQGSKAYNNKAVLKWLDKGIPVIIKVDGKPIGGLSHFVLAVGDGKIADPWTGKIRNFSDYKALGYNAYDYKKEIMPDNKELEACMKDRKKFWEERDKALEKIKELEKTVSSLALRATKTEKENKLLIRQLEEKELLYQKAEELREKWHTLYKQSQINFNELKIENGVLKTKLTKLKNDSTTVPQTDFVKFFYEILMNLDYIIRKRKKKVGE